MQSAPATTESATIWTEEQLKCVMLLGLSSSRPFQAYSFVCTCISQKIDHVQRTRTPKGGLALDASYWLNISLCHFLVFCCFFGFVLQSCDWMVSCFKPQLCMAACGSNNSCHALCSLAFGTFRFEASADFSSILSHLHTRSTRISINLLWFFQLKY